LKGKRVFLDGQVTAQSQVDCDRCLTAIEFALDERFHVEYLTRVEYESSPAEELEGEDMTVSVFDGEAIDLDELVREQLLLAIPQRTLCREDCQGLCATCGVDRNLKECSCESAEIDPRWAALKKLQGRS
jgi:uncharacterized protein